MQCITDNQLNTGAYKERSVSLAEFRSQYAERVLVLLGRDIRKAASTLGVQGPEVEILVNYASK